MLVAGATPVVTTEEVKGRCGPLEGPPHLPPQPERPPGPLAYVTIPRLSEAQGRR